MPPLGRIILGTVVAPGSLAEPVPMSGGEPTGLE